jgi:hypothetical protein
MSLLHKYHQFHLLSEFLKKEGVPDAYPIYFREESEADNRFALSVSIHPRNGRLELLRKLATFFGCPEDALPNPEDDSFEASDSWHGGANGDLRELADEMAKEIGEGFFDIDYTAGEIHRRGAEMKEATKEPDTMFVAMVSEGQCRESSDTFVGRDHAEMVAKVAAWCRKEWDLHAPLPEDDVKAVDTYFADGDLVLVWGPVPCEPPR